jgi:VWFA-related protein
MDKSKLLKGLIVLTTALVVLLAPVTAQAQGMIEATINETENEEFPLIRATVTVIDENGIPVPGLDISNFKIFEDDAPAPAAITSVTPITADDVAVSFALLVDISGSMSIPSVRPINDAKAAATSFVSQLGTLDSMAIVAFGSQVNLGEPFPQIDTSREIDFTRDRDALNNLIANLEAKDEWTALYDGIFKGVRMTSRQPAGNRAVIVLTDGCEDAPPGARTGGSVLDREAPISEAVRYGIPVFTIGLGTEIDADYLSEIALRTGGTYVSTQDSQALTELFQSVLERLKLRYIVEYRSKALADGEEHSLQIEVGTPAGEDTDITTFMARAPGVPAVRQFFSFREGQRDAELKDGQEVGQPLQITVQIDHRDALERVEYYLDGTEVFSTTVEPYVFLWDVAQYEPLTHTLMARVHDVDGDVGTGSIDLVVPAAPPLTPQELLARYWWAMGIALLILAIVAALFVALRGRRQALAACPQCGQTLDPDWAKCPSCGTPVSGAARLPTEAGVYRPTPEEGSTIPDQATADTETMSETPAVERAARTPETVILGEAEEHLALLFVEKGERRGQEFRLHRGDTTVGRLGTNDIVISGETVSRNQAKIRLEGTEYYIYDLGATNPTRVNSQDIARHRLEPDDRIEIGDTILVFKRVAAK